MKYQSLPALSAERILLRPIRMSDRFDYHQHLASDPIVAQFMLWNANPDISHTESTIQRILKGYKEGNRYHWGIALRETDTLIGTIALVQLDEEKKTCGFAYMLGQRYWGNGYATEALSAVLRFAFEELSVSQITADHFEGNNASGAVMEKVGMSKTGILPCRYEKNGAYHNAVQYTLTQADWKTRRTDS